MNSKTFISGFLAGTAAGIGIGILLNSSSAEVKETLVEGAKKIAGAFDESVDEIAHQDKAQNSYVEDSLKKASAGKRAERSGSGA